ncbi:hypothetical protein ACTG9Q_24665 [Actinokineospora sp. 24-640]
MPSGETCDDNVWRFSSRQRTIEATTQHPSPSKFLTVTVDVAIDGCRNNAAEEVAVWKLLIDGETVRDGVAFDNSLGNTGEGKVMLPPGATLEFIAERNDTPDCLPTLSLTISYDTEPDKAR